MNFKNRLNLGKKPKPITVGDAHAAAVKLFGKLSGGVVIAGYLKGTHEKFVFKITDGGIVYDDAMASLIGPPKRGRQ